jgi:hypothetical protein
MKVCTLPAALALLAASVTSANADVVKLQREDVAAAMSLRWIGDDGVRRSDSHAELHTFESGNSDYLQFVVAAVPSAVDRTEASYGTSYRRVGAFIEADVNGAVVEDRPEARFNHTHQLAFELTFRVDGNSTQLNLYKHRLGGVGPMDILLFDHTSRRFVMTVVGSRFIGQYAPIGLVDGHQYTLIVRMSSSGPGGVEYGLAAYFESTSGEPVELVPAAGWWD